MKNKTVELWGVASFTGRLRLMGPITAEEREATYCVSEREYLGKTGWKVRSKHAAHRDVWRPSRAEALTAFVERRPRELEAARAEVRKAETALVEAAEWVETQRAQP